MKYRFRKPELVPTIAVICAVALTFSLAVWQVKRLHWKTALLNSIEAAQSRPPEPLLSIPINMLPRHEWHNVKITGRFVYDKELYATPRYLNGVMGYAVLTPLAIPTPKGMRYVLINRGWVAPDHKDRATRKDGDTEGPVIVEGIIRTTLKHAMFVPDNDPAKNIWFWYDLPAMAQATKLQLAPVLIDATRVTTGYGMVLSDGPKPFPVEINIRNDHLGYAITWFLIGCSALTIYALYYLERGKK